MGGINRAVLMVLDGVGMGAAPDARLYGDENTNTLLHVAQACPGLKLPHLQALGLGNILSLPGIPPVSQPRASYGSLEELSVGKDTIVGHWELAGLVQKEPFPTFPQGFSEDIMAQFRRATGLEFLGNEAASGTEIIQRLGPEHCRSGNPIVYTSADSVFQIAAHENIIPVPKLYHICRKTRELLNPYRVARVIARPFKGTPENGFERTAERHDFTMPPPGPTLLDRLAGAGLQVFGVGKIVDIFAGRGVTDFVYTRDNADGMEKTLKAIAGMDRGLVFTNLVDFDMRFGHRRDALGFGRALEDFDAWLPRLLSCLNPDDVLVITADHGCDPRARGTDHTRELVPVLACQMRDKVGKSLGRQHFSWVAGRLAQGFGLEGTRV